MHGIIILILCRQGHPGVQMSWVSPPHNGMMSYRYFQYKQWQKQRGVQWRVIAYSMELW